ncbi:MAG: hypothetical protein HDS56_06360 [Barnesiella sp.]|nr:hypothetical protein [Bacteroidales bacterium]MBD5250781.1 hypothetical protein [Barnesiella sp.]
MNLKPAHIILSLIFAASSCIGSSGDKAGVIQENSAWRVTADSYSDANISIRFLPDSDTVDFPVLISTTPLLDQLYSAGVNEYFSDASTIHSGVTSLWNPAILSLLDPEIAAEQVMMKARQSLTTCRDWPLEANDASWISSLGDLSLALGDSFVTDSLLPIAKSVIDRELAVAFDYDLSLFRGLLPEIPAIVSRTDVLEIYSLRVNIDRASAIKTLGELLPADIGAKYITLAKKMAESINDRFWIPEKGRYGCALWGKYYPILVTASDNLAQSLAILKSIATPEMAQSIMRSMPLTDEGAPDFYPVPSGVRPSYSLSTQTGVYAAASMTHNSNKTLLGLAAAAAATFDGIGSMPASALLGSLGGVSITSDGLTISPYVPEIFSGDKIFTSLIYRNDTINLHINGTGSRVARMEIDGIQTLSHLIPDSLSGHHRIDVIMANNTPADRHIEYAEVVTFPPRPEIDSVSINRYTVVSPAKDYNYIMAVNGIACKVISDGAFTVAPSSAGMKVITAMTVDAEGYSSIPAREHMVFNPADTMIVDRHDIPHELRKAVAARIERNARRKHKRKESIPTHLELTGELNTELTFTVKAPHAGEYYIDLAYWRPAVTECFITDLVTSDSVAGCFIMPALKGYSSPLTVRLKRGRNRFKLIYHPLPSGNLQSGVCIEYIRFLPKKL